ncbi:Alpha/Beta hydrolase protein [Chiua virens]|nr:Alpha/Beta hydrolase protein [Chiua virens]
MTEPDTFSLVQSTVLVTLTSNPSHQGVTGSVVQYWYVGYEPSLDTVIVVHEGTDFSKILPIITDIDVILAPLDASLFPGLPSHIRVHSGFLHDQSVTASDIISSVQRTMTKYGTNSVTLVGHSLGTTFRSVLFGLPRVGNQAFADYVDANLYITHVNNLKDPIPTLPGMPMCYVHPSGEVHITETGEWAACPVSS